MSRPLTHVDKQPTIDALAAVWSSTRELVSSLEPEQWKQPTPLPGWDVQANIAHVIGTEAMLLGIDAPNIDIDPEQSPHVLNDIGKFNEAWIVHLSAMSPEEITQRFTDYTAQRLESLQSMGQDEWDAESWTPAGKDTYGRFMRIRAFDCWMHEQDIRDGLGRPGHGGGIAVDVALDEMSATLPYVVGKKAGAPSGARVTFELQGDARRTIHVEVDERAAVVPELSGPATTTLTMPVGTFSRLAGGRIEPDDARRSIEIEGDAALADQLIDNANYTI